MVGIRGAFLAGVRDQFNSPLGQLEVMGNLLTEGPMHYTRIWSWVESLELICRLSDSIALHYVEVSPTQIRTLRTSSTNNYKFFKHLSFIIS